VARGFVDAGIAEIAALRAAQAPAGRRAEAFRHEAAALSDVLQFEFFFPDAEAHLAQLDAELARLGEGFPARFEHDVVDVLNVLKTVRRPVAETFLRATFEAYALAADALAEVQAETPDEAQLLRRCFELGAARLGHGEITRPEALSRHLLQSGVRVARHRTSQGPAGEQAHRRRQFAREMAAILEALEALRGA
jgi:glycerol-3-phosphate O-acyltransferase